MPAPHATLRSDRSPSGRARPAGVPRRPGDAEDDHADAEAEVGHVGLGAVGGGDDEGHEHDVVAAQHGPHRQQHEHPCEQREVRVPRLGQRQLPVAAHDEGEQRGDDSDAAPSEPAPPDPQRHGDRRQVDDDRADLHRPRRRAEGAVRRREQVEAERSRMAALVRERADAPGQPDQRRVGTEDVAHPVLGHRQVEHRVPALAAQGDDRHDEREPDDGSGEGDDPARAAPPGLVTARRVGRARLDHKGGIVPAG